MASTATQRPSLSSASNSKWSYDVFLSFRGEDTRYNFTNYLYLPLIHNGIRTFRDKENLHNGGEIGAELVKAIEGSRICVIVFSETYAHSKWCLEELAKIMECKKEREQIVIPIFYHVDPSQVRNQTGIYGEAFADHERYADEEKREKIQKWRSALSEACGIAGHGIMKNRFESELIEEITHQIRRLIPKLLQVDENIVGMDEKLEEVKLLIGIQSNDVRKIGIYGIGGIGKTTIAKVVYNDILHQFEGSSFLENVREKSKDESGLLQLQEKLLHDIIKEKILKLDNIDEGAMMIKRGFSTRKVLVVLDDVDNLKQIEFLIGGCQWFGLGSRIIITTRDKRCLDVHKVYVSYEIKGLKPKEAIELFSWNAFHQSCPKHDYMDLTNGIVEYTKGHPLALNLLGSSLFNRKISEWESTFQKLKRKLPMDIKNVLEISYVGLDDTCKELFLDIACFFKDYEENLVTRIIECCHPGGRIGLSVLNEKCLITLSDGIIGMHDLLQEMGWEIARQKHPQEPGKWRRLWEYEDISTVFATNSGTEAIEGILLDMSKSKKIHFTSKAFKRMKRLRLLKVYCKDHYSGFKEEDYKMLSKGFEFPSHELRYLHWDKYSLKSLSSNFHGEKLVELSLRSSNIKRVWKGCKNFDKLKVIDLSYSQKLIEMPKFWTMPNLERLDLRGCKSLRKLHPSIGVLKKLTFLDLRECKKLSSFPSSLEFKSLEVLFIGGSQTFEKFHTTPGNMRQLRELYISETGIKELPSSIEYLVSLEVLSLSRCQNFEKFPEIYGNIGRLRELYLILMGIKELPGSIECLTSLEVLWLYGCKKLEKFPEIHGNVGHLRELNLNETGIKELPNSFQYLTSLEILDLSYCSYFEKMWEIFGNMRYIRELRMSLSDYKEFQSNIHYSESLEAFGYCPGWFQKNMKGLPSGLIYCGTFSPFETAIKKFSLSISHLTKTKSEKLQKQEKSSKQQLSVQIPPFPV